MELLSFGVDGFWGKVVYIRGELGPQRPSLFFLEDGPEPEKGIPTLSSRGSRNQGLKYLGLGLRVS